MLTGNSGRAASRTARGPDKLNAKRATPVTVRADVQVAGGAPIPPGGLAMIMRNADAARPWLSFASMVAVSNDAFIGVATGDSAIDLCPGGRPFNGVIVAPHAGILGVGDIPLRFKWVEGNVARTTIVPQPTTLSLLGLGLFALLRRRG